MKSLVLCAIAHGALKDRDVVSSPQERRLIPLLTRRGVLRSAGATGVVLLSGGFQLHTESPEDDPFPPLPADLQGSRFEDYFDVVVEVQQLGAAKPTPREEKLAREVIAAAPYNTTPHAVALFFREVGQGKLGEEYRPFASGWPIRYNPVIIEFFKATELKPLDPNGVGDATFWCAAFVNWCIARARSKDGNITTEGLNAGTRSASSGSFRCWGQPTHQPKKGDVVVWAVRGTVRDCNIGPGHVAFYDGDGSPDETRIAVIGGNQRDQEFKRNAVTRQTYGRMFKRGPNSRPLSVDLHSFRTAEPLR